MLLMAFVGLAPNALAQSPSRLQPVVIDAAERRILTSAVNGTTYQIDIALPRGYRTSGKRYPVVYVLDGNALFPLVTSSYRLVSYLVPQELIVVGVGYPTNEYGPWSKDYGLHRTRDYTPPKAASGTSTGEGGAPLFLQFLREELIPDIDANYRTVLNDRALLGHSYGGLFAAWVLTHEPGLFQRYSIGSPSLWWDNETGPRWEAAYAAGHSDLRARVYLYAAAYEDEGIMKGPSTRFWEALRARHYTGLDLVDFVIVPDEIHTSVLLGAVEHALRKLYAPTSVALHAETMRRYSGTWKVGSEPAWTVGVAGGRLVIDIPAYATGPLEGRAPERRELLAESETSFFSELGDLRVAFTWDGRTQSATQMRISYPRFGYAAVLSRSASERRSGDTK
jgi:predicted alpha/beta superfamily hydrolase